MLAIESIVVVNNELAIAWSDGGESFLGFEELRRACPCASCRGEPDALGRVVRPDVTFQENSFHLVRYQPIGGYAVQLHFADGHGTGIYSFDHLRAIGQG